MKEVPKYNVEDVLVDVKRPGFESIKLGRRETVLAPLESLTARNGEKKRAKERDVSLSLTGFAKEGIVIEKSKRAGRGWWIGGGTMFAVVFLIVAVGMIGLQSVKKTAAEKGERVASNILSSVDSLKNLNPQQAEQALLENEYELKDISGLINGGGGILKSLGSIFPALNSGMNLVSGVSNLNDGFLELTKYIGELQTQGFTYFQKDGKRLVQILKSTKSLVEGMATEAATIKNTTSRLGSVSNSFKKFDGLLGATYLKQVSELHDWTSALESLIKLLDSKEERRILVMFQNPSEMRPSGGFLGSYGEIIVGEGEMKKLEVQDIYWPDHPKNFTRKIIPPEPLQGITDSWGARDGNWFFDFPTSAKTVSELLESSKLYKDQGVTFDGVIAINTHVLESILRAVGPIEIPEYKLVIDEQNFLAELQREVEEGKDKKEGKNPKKILSTVAPTIIERLNSLDEKKREELVGEIGEHIKKKDIMISMKDGELAGFLKKRGIDGSVYDLPYNFWGSYIAVVGANIASGKSDIFIDEKISGRIDVSSDGSSFVNLSVEKTHKGQNEKDYWYRSENKSYMQIFTNQNSSLINMEGAWDKKLPQRLSYEALGYEKNKTLEEIEKTEVYINDMKSKVSEQFGKTVFASWFRVSPGKTVVLELKYQTKGEKNFNIEEKKPYILVFEKQSGSRAIINIKITAPLGYIWRESNEPVYVFEREYPDAREIVELHLIKN